MCSGHLLPGSGGAIPECISALKSPNRSEVVECLQSEDCTNKLGVSPGFYHEAPYQGMKYLSVFPEFHSGLSKV